MVGKETKHSPLMENPAPPGTVGTDQQDWSAADLRLMNALNRAANQGASLQAIFEMLHEETRRLFGCYGTTVYLIDNTGECLEMQNLAIPAAAARQVERLTGLRLQAVKVRLRESSLYRKMLETGTPTITNDTAVIEKMMAEYTDQARHRKLVPAVRKLLGIGSVVSVPLVLEGKPIGLVDMAHSHPLANIDLERLTGFGEQLAAVIARKQLEDQLREGEARFRRLYDDAPLSYQSLDEDGRLLEVNPTWLAEMLYTREQVIGRPFVDLVARAERKHVTQTFARFLATGSVRGIRHPLLRGDGTTFTAELTGKVIRDAQSGALRTHCIFVNVDERTRGEQALRASLEESARGRRLLLALSRAAQEVQRAGSAAEVYRIAGDQAVELGYSASLLSLTDDQTRLRIERLSFEPSMLRTLEQMTGVSRADYSFTPPQGGFYRRLIDAQETVFTHRAIEPIAEALPRPLRSLARRVASLIDWQQSIIAPIVVEGRVDSLLIMSGTDLTENDVQAVTVLANQAAAALKNLRLLAEVRHSELQYRTILESSADAIVSLDPEHRIAAWSAGAQQLLGYRREEIIGRSLETLVPEHDCESTILRLQEVDEKGFVRGWETQRLAKDGRALDVDMTVSSLGPELGTTIILRDIGPRRQAEEELRRSEEFNRGIIASSLDCIKVLDREGRLLFMSAGGQRLMEIDDIEAHLNMSWLDLWEGAEREAACAALEEARRGGVGIFRGHCPTARGTMKWWDVVTTPIRDAAGNVDRLLSVSRDVTAQVQAQTALQESEGRFRDLFQGIPACCFTYDREGTVANWNRACEELYGWTAAEAIGSSMYDLMVKEDNAAATRANIAAVFEGKSLQGLEFQDWRADGTSCRVLASEYPLRDADGQVVRGICAELDITERVEAQIALAASEAHLQSIFRAAPIGMGVVSDRVIVEVNDRFCDMLGYPRDELIGQSSRILYPSDQEYEQVGRLKYGQLRETGIGTVRTRLRRRDGRIVHTILSSSLLFPADPAAGVTFTALDISEQVVSEAEVARLGTVIDQAAVTVIITDVAGDIVYVNPDFVRTTGYSVTEALGRNPRFLQSGRQDASIYRQMWDTLSAGATWNGVLINRRKDGELYYEEATLFPIKNPAGATVNYAAVKRDITTRREAEAALERRARHQASLNAVITTAAKASNLQQLLDSVLTCTMQAFVAEIGGIWTGERHAIRGLLPETIQTVIQSIKPLSLDLPRRIAVDDLADYDGGGPRADLRSLLMAQGVRAGLVVPIRAGTETVGGLSLGDYGIRSWTEEEVDLLEAIGRQLGGAIERLGLLDRIQAQARQMQDVLGSVPEGVLLLSGDFRIVMANPTAKIDMVALDGAQVGDELTHLAGLPLDTLLTSPPRGIWHELTAEDRTFELLARPVTSQTGIESSGWVVVIRDVTRERELQEQTQRQERLAAVGQLAAGIAHDFNNILAVILLYAQMSQNTPGVPAAVQNRLGIIGQQTVYATQLINQILDFGRTAVLERKPLDMGLVVREQVGLLERTLPESIRIVLSSGHDDYTVKADLTRMQQVIMNLVVNARDAMLPHGSGELHIRLSRMTGGDTLRCVVCGDAVIPENTSWIRMDVEDNGCGIPEEALPRIFDPFFTTKDHGQGTGLGLAQVFGIVKQHDGHIDVTTRVDQGSRFSIYLPTLSVGASAEEVTRRAQGLPQGKGETVLLVEDNPHVRESVSAILTQLNYRVLEASDGREALEMHAAHDSSLGADSGHEIALVLSDLVMPDIGGQALFHALRQRNSAIKVALMTGHPLQEELEGLRAQGLDGWLPKPPSLEQLADLVARLLE